jgi:hypothetical protein
LAIKTANAHVCNLAKIHSKTILGEDESDHDETPGQFGNGYHYCIKISKNGICSMEYVGDKYGRRGHYHRKVSAGVSCLSQIYPAAAVIMRIVKNHATKKKPPRNLSIPVFTELKRKDDKGEWQLYRADPILNHENKISKTSRNDWAWCGWNNSGFQRGHEKIVARILCFLENTEDTRTFFTDLPNTEEPAMVFQSLDREQTTAIDIEEKLDVRDMQHPASRLLFRGVLETEHGKNIPQVYVNTCNIIFSPAAVIRDFNHSIPEVQKFKST